MGVGGCNCGSVQQDGSNCMMWRGGIKEEGSKGGGMKEEGSKGEGGKRRGRGERERAREKWGENKGESKRRVCDAPRRRGVHSKDLCARECTCVCRKHFI